jgi:hypothetical protein
MKYSLIAVLLILGGTQANVNGPVDGYLITSANDTVWCKIHVSGLQLFDEVHIVDSLGKDSSRSVASVSTTKRATTTTFPRLMKPVTGNFSFEL